MTKKETVFLLGGGTMGCGLAAVFAKAGYTVNLYSRSQSTRDAAKGKIRGIYDQLAKDKVVRRSEIEPALDRIEVFADLEPARQAALVIENVQENLDLKREIFASLDKIAPPETILATNSSSFTLAAIGTGVNHKERLLATHFFNPAYMMPLVEIASSTDTAQWATDKAAAIITDIEKVPVFCRDSSGYIAVRLQIALVMEAISLLEQGLASAEDIDKAVRNSIGLRLAMWGPIEMADRGGLEVWNSTAESLYKTYGLSKFEPPQLLKDMVAKGDLGVKTGVGLHGDTAKILAAGRDRELITLIQHLGLLPKVEED